ncbi:cytochrome P450 [Fomes fomentarius]|nr:cytochrome P450 [Fomes fomentarius]
MDGTAVLLVAFTALYTLWRIFRHYLKTYDLDNLPGPSPSSWFLGNTSELAQRDSWKRVAAIADTYGPVSVLSSILGRRLILVHDPKALNNILIKDYEFLQKGLAPSTSFNILLGPGVLTAHGAQHRRQRKLLNPVFSAKHLRDMTHIFYGVAHRLKMAIKSRLPSDGSAEVLDMNAWNGRTTLEMLGQAGLGYSFDNFVDDSFDAYGESLKSFFPVLNRVRLLKFVVERMSYVFSDQMIRRILRLVPHKQLQRLLDISDIMFQRSQEIIDERKTALQKGDAALWAQVGEGKDIMSICLKANMAATPKERMTDEEILAQTSTFILAGMDTTSNALSRVLHLLSLYPDAQRKLRAEIYEATNGGTTDLDYDDIMKLPYLDAVCRETLRVFSPVALAGRVATKNLVLPFSEPVRGRDGRLMHEVVVPKGTVVLSHFQASNSNAALWGEDARAWRPDRWLAPLPQPLEDAPLPGVYAHLLTFSGGSRSCIGFKFSQLEMKIVLAILLTNFSFELTDEPIVWNSLGVIYPTMGEQKTEPELLLKVRVL